MAYDNDQNEPILPVDGNEKRQSSDLLPRFFRTKANKKFLASTLDQLTQPGKVEKLNGYVGRKVAKAFTPNDNYLGDVSNARQNYQLEPAALLKNNIGEVNFYKDYNDYTNQINNFNGNVDNHSLLNSQENYPWNPNIDFDKFTNFREYYWLPSGPQTVTVFGQTKEVQSTYTVNVADNADNNAYVFSPDGKTQNPTLKLYRGITYKFIVDTPNLPITFRTRRTLDDQFLLDTDSTDTGISSQGTEQGTITLTLNQETPDTIYYVADNDIEAAGLIKVANIEEASAIDVEAEVLGKLEYTSSTGFSLSNGMKIEFGGEVTPSKYAEGAWYVEGVGDKITLTSEKDLEVPTEFTEDFEVEFDAAGFDRLPFSEAIGFPRNKDYIVINRASIDGNLWSRYNRWYHRDIIIKSAEINNQPIEVDQSQRATRPIIEFESGLKLFNYGTKTKKSIDLIDTFTKDAFSTIEGKIGYNIDGVNITKGMRILFVADTDILVKNKIFEVDFIKFASGSATNTQITLKETEDSDPLENEVLLVTQGNVNKGKTYFYNDNNWIEAQRKTGTNQSPLFDIFDEEGTSYGDTVKYPSTTFTGNKIFTYKEGTGTNDTELGFPITYRNIDNVGDIVFNFDLLTGTCTYTVDNDVITLYSNVGYLRSYTDLNEFESVTGWKKASTQSTQPVIQQFVFDNSISQFPIDVYDNSANLNDLKVIVYKNNVLQAVSTDYTVGSNSENFATVNFVNELTIDDVILIKTFTKAVKNNNGYYELPLNFEKNPENNDLTEFTLGEVNDHVATVIESLDNFTGVYPGTSNLRDIKKLSTFGRKIVKHSAPLNLSLYHLLDEDANIVNALKYSAREYGKFKRTFLQVAESLGFEGSVKDHFDKIMLEINRDKTNRMPFYFSDMIPTGANQKTDHTIIDSDERYFALNSVFLLDEPSRKGVQVYLNGQQLIYTKDYTFTSEGFVDVTAEKVPGDVITVYEYENTNGSFVPPTPTKLGLYPKYEPALYLDNTYQIPTNVIQGHDGSITIAYNDYRDQLILELEKRIFNNIKTEYDTNIFDIHDFVGGENRDTQVKKANIDTSMLQEFVKWTKLIDQDYTDNDTYSRINPFTFNYYLQVDQSGNRLPGFWRQVYQHAYDTDRPHTHPWEMLGFSIKPKWWEEQYGPAPYTNNNLIMWQDLEKGIIREPNKKYKINKKYIRANLTNHIPVDENGALLSPSESNYINTFNGNGLDSNWVFGDGAPVESAWRRSSQYPFGIILAYVLNKPSEIFSKGFDRVRQVRNNSGNIVYKDTQKQIRLKDIVFPNTIDETTQIYTSGLVNYIYNYMTADVLKNYTEYKENIKNLQTQIGFKLGGFTEKSKFKLILDSRSPLNAGNVFVPDENYKIFLNQSTPVELVNYSGVIVEKQSNGYIIKGYSDNKTSFNYYATIKLQNDPVINVGGVSEPYVEWAPGKQYVQGANIEYQGSYYRVKKDFISGSSFDTEDVAKLPQLPLIGGRDAIIKKTFNKNVINTLPYGTLLRTPQEVVDFLVGYGEYLKDKGFSFEAYDGEQKTVLDFIHSSKEFLYWTTQNWSAGAVITLSPGATSLKFKSDYATIDNVFDNFYGYSIFKADGKKLFEEFTDIGREGISEFSLTPKNTADGIFNITLALIQKEHVVLLDNKTVFGDIIYDLEPGYRQERIKISGYKTGEWDGSLNIPGFIYDDVKITEWEPWNDYGIGAVVKYKEFYYSANEKVPGTETFNDNQWTRLSEEPVNQLISNFDYKTNQFADFYDLDSDNFDTEQQRLAQHLIGYQKRQYLENIINDSVSQYKFYQGFILDKGTKNALTKLFDALASSNQDSLEFFEEWAIKSGQYGASEGFDEVEYKLDESKFRLKPQPILLTNDKPADAKDLVYRINSSEVYLAPENYDHKPFVTKYIDKPFTKDAGFVNTNDVLQLVKDKDAIVQLNYDDVNKGTYLWIGNEGLSYDVVQHIDSGIEFEKLDLEEGGFNVTCKSTPNLNVGDVVGIGSAVTETVTAGSDSSVNVENQTLDLGGFFKISKIDKSKISFVTENPPVPIEKCRGKVTEFRTVKASNNIEANEILQKGVQGGDLIWISDSGNGRWSVKQNNEVWNKFLTLQNTAPGSTNNYGTAIAADLRNTTLAVGAPDENDGKVYIYKRPADGTSLTLAQELTPTIYGDSSERFGASIDISEDGKYLIVGSPASSNNKTKYRSTWSASNAYSKADIVKKDDSLWRANTAILPETGAVTFDSFYSGTKSLIDTGNTANSNNPVNVMLTGGYPIRGIDINHILVRAPKATFDGAGINDQIRLEWNTLSYSYQDQSSLTVTQPFAGGYAQIDEAFIKNNVHTIQKKVETVLYINSATIIPEIGDTVQTNLASAKVVHVVANTNEISIYVNEQTGTFEAQGTLFNNSSDFVGEFIRVAPNENIDVSDTWNGFFFIDTPTYTITNPLAPAVGTATADEGRGLVFIDTITDSTDLNLRYNNSLDNDTSIINSRNTFGSEIGILSNQGAPGAYGVTTPITSPRYYFRVSKTLSDNLTNGQELNLFVSQLPRYSDNSYVDITATGLSTTETNRAHTIVDLWDGYVNYDITQFDGGDPLEPLVGQTVQDFNTGAEGVIVHYERNSLNATVFIKNVTGTWSEGFDFGANSNIRMLAIPGSVNPLYTVDRTLGQIQYVSLGYAPEDIGKLVIVETQGSTDISLDSVTSRSLRFVEYYAYTDRTVSGIPRDANIPSSVNNDWTQIYNVPLNIGGVASGYTDEGHYSIYERNTNGDYLYTGSYTLPEVDNNYKLGSTVKFAKSNDLYRAFVYSDNNNPGRIHFLKNGIENGITYNWEIARNKKYRGTFSNLQTYFTGDIVYVESANAGIGQLYSALTNIAPGSFNSADWTLKEDLVDYVGYIPNDQSISVINDSAFDSSVLDQGGLLSFGKEFDTSQDGKVLIATTAYNNDKPNLLVVYRENNGFYYRAQQIEAPSNTVGFGESVAISNDGMMIAVGAPYDDSQADNQGLVYIYKQSNGAFQYYQTLYSPNNERAEMFGYALQFDGNTLAITARNADSYIKTTFDTYSSPLSGYVLDPASTKNLSPTVFDNQFTDFKKVNEDSGVVYLYETTGAGLLFGQTINVDNTNVNYFGRNILAMRNHLYVGLPTLTEGSNTGQILNYRKNIDAKIYVDHRVSKDPVDVSKIKRVILYNTKTNKLLTYLDYIDPLQGKIAGPADENIRFKTIYDPAVYSVGNTTVSVDASDPWNEKNVGQVWWDLTNAKFVNPYQDNIIYSTNNWNTVFPGNAIEIYEWVESSVLPSEWDTLSDTNDGFTQGYSGKSKYGDNVYSTNRVYDSIKQSFSTKYYFWVKDKVTIPNIENRSLSIKDITTYITDPASTGYKFVNLISSDSFVLHNCDNLIEDKDVALSVQYWTIENQSQNIHNQYQLITEGLDSSKPNRDVESKWFDSLVGYDNFGRPVPDPDLPAKQKYGNLAKPRQGWFVNRTEALKQFVDRTNGVLKQNLIIDDKSITKLFNADPQPSAVSRLYDTTVDTVSDLTLLGVAKAETAKLTPVISKGKITRVIIDNPGRGYQVAPTYEITGTGSGAVINLAINSLGKITEATVVESGTNYDIDTTIEVRKYSVLVRNDETILGKWALYERIPEEKRWNRINSASYDVTQFWNYIDWYDTGYSDFTEIDFLVDNSYELTSLENVVGDIVKIKNIGSGGWLLLEKIDDQDTTDYTVNYKTVGRQNGTIKFKSTVYDTSSSAVGYDTKSYDTKSFDNQPTIELRFILNAIKEDILIDELAIEYNKLFFSSIRYVLSEQNYVDWLFKTSFIKAKHNVGELREDITFNNDNLPSYEEYVKEVKPFSTKIREYLSAYEKIEQTRTVVTDFDLPPKYNFDYGEILPEFIKIENDTLIGSDAAITTYPNKNWLDNHTHKVEKIVVADGGSGYLSAPQITLVGGGGTGATAQAFVGNGKVTSIEVTNKGSGYTSAPTMVLDVNQEESGTPVKASVILEDNSVRTIHTVVKYDRVKSYFEIQKLSTEESFVSPGSQFDFDLKWPMDLGRKNITVLVDNTEALRSEYTYQNVLDQTKGYDRYFGRITFIQKPDLNKVVKVQYKKDVTLLDAADRINLYYDPQTGQMGKNLSQLMDGVDYGGVEVKSFGFDTSQGFDSNNFYEGGYDTYDTSFEDEIFEFDGSTIEIRLSKPLEAGKEYHIYKNSVRLDDPEYDGSTVTSNANAIMRSLTGDGVTQTMYLDDFKVQTPDPYGSNTGVAISVKDGDTLIIRKSTSDGTFLPDAISYDTVLQGGNLNYSTATGVSAEDINVDGDGFVTPTTSKGPEELVPGQILDTLDIQVYERPTGGASQIYTTNFVANGVTTRFKMGTKPILNNNIFVKVDFEIQDPSTYTIDYSTDEVVFTTAPADQKRINITVLGISGASILDIDEFIGDGSTREFLTSVTYNDNLEYYATVNGVKLESNLSKAGNNYEYPGNVVIKFGEPPAEDAKVRFAIFQGLSNTEIPQNFSEVAVDTFTADGSTQQFTLTTTPFTVQPSAWSLVVEINDKILNPGYAKRFTTQSGLLEYKLELWQVPAATVRASEVLVKLDGIELTEGSDYEFIGANDYDSSIDPESQDANIIRLKGQNDTDGKVLEVYVLTDGEYALGYLDSNNNWVKDNDTIYLNQPFSDGDIINVYQFSNNSSQNIERINYELVNRTTLTVGSQSWYDSRHLKNGLIELYNTAVDAQYVWVSVNGELLNSSVDYYVTDNRKYVKVIKKLNDNDVVDVLHFAGDKVVDKFGWRQFKDMLNRNHYKRLDGEEDVILTQDLQITDNVIYVSDGSKLSEPSKDAKHPGVIFVHGERIEYYVRKGNELQQIRRGTLGTGASDIYVQGTEIYPQSENTNLPYKDKTITTILTADGTSTTYTLDFTPSSVNEFEVFVAGKRLRKTELQYYQTETYDNNGSLLTTQIAQDSPEGDITLPAQFTVAGDQLTLTEPPGVNQKIIIVRRQGKLWTDPGTKLSIADTDIARFLRAKQVDLPS